MHLHVYGLNLCLQWPVIYDTFDILPKSANKYQQCCSAPIIAMSICLHWIINLSASIEPMYFCQYNRASELKMAWIAQIQDAQTQICHVFCPKLIRKSSIFLKFCPTKSFDFTSFWFAHACSNNSSILEPFSWSNHWFKC